MIFYDFQGEKMVDIKMLMKMTNNSKSTLIRLLKKRKTPYITYQNRRIYFLTDFLNEESGIFIPEFQENVSLE